MARQHRIEYAGALYHVMARGDRHEPIVRDDKNRLRFISTLGEVCCRTGFVVHAYVLPDNHYHPALETPEGNLVDGMRWLQNTYTRRYNVRHNVWGHLFGGRYKALLVEEQDPGYLRCLIDYIHLNVVRAGLVEPGGHLEAFPWSSLREYVMVPGHRSGWLSVERGMSVLALQDNARDRRKYLERLVAQMRSTNSCDVGLVNTKGLGLSLQNTIRRGWYFGSQDTRYKVCERNSPKLLANKMRLLKIERSTD